MTNLLSRFVRSLGARSKDMGLLCQQLLSQAGEATQTAIAQRIIGLYKSMDSSQRLAFFEMLASQFNAEPPDIRRAFEQYDQAANPAGAATLFAAVEPPRQELLRRINTGRAGTETLVTMRGDLLRLLPKHSHLEVVDADLKHLFKSWFNRGFLRLERIGWHTSALTLEKLIRYESVHEISGWPDLRRRLQADRRCFAFFHPALSDQPVIFVEVALTRGLALSLAPLLDISAPVLLPEQADTAIFYSISNCLKGLKGIPFGNFLIKQVVDELGAELPRITCHSTLSPLPLFAQALRSGEHQDGFTRERLRRLLADFGPELTRATGQKAPVDAMFQMLENPTEHLNVLSAPLRRLALAYLTQLRTDNKPYDSVAYFHFSNGAHLESINPFANLRPYGLRDSFGVMVNYMYRSREVEENHERFIRNGQLCVSARLRQELKIVAQLWGGKAPSIFAKQQKGIGRTLVGKIKRQQA
jgi:malonyl-CoA decarboxylase